MIKFTDFSTRTITYLGSLYQNSMEGKTNLVELNKCLIATDQIKLIKYEQNAIKKKTFSHSCTVGINIIRTWIKIKIYSNGALQTTGVKNNDEKLKIIAVLNETFSKLNPAIFQFPLKIEINETPMVVLQSKIINKIQLDCNKINSYIKEHYSPKINSKYRKIGAGIEISHNSVTYTLFKSGKINISYGIIEENNDAIISFIVNLINKHIDNFIMLDRFKINIDNIEKTNQIKQGSEEWHKLRRGKITATKLGACVGMGYGGKSKRAQINEIAEELDGNEKSFSNIYTQHGTRYETVARNVFLFHKSYFDKNFKYAIFESGMIVHRLYDFIAASPDGFLFIFNNKINKIPATIEELKQAYVDKMIVEVSMIEIKCPFKYKIYSENDPHVIKCVNGCIPDNYWAQMQQQMAVTGITHATFINNNIYTYNSEEDFEENLITENYKGIIVDYTLKDDNNIPEKHYTLYPEYADTLCSSIERKNDIKKRLVEQIKKNDKINQYSFIYWYMKTLPTMILVAFDENWYNNTALPAMIEVIAEAKKIYENKKQ